MNVLDTFVREIMFRVPGTTLITCQVNGTTECITFDYCQQDRRFTKVLTWHNVIMPVDMFFMISLVRHLTASVDTQIVFNTNQDVSRYVDMQLLQLDSGHTEGQHRIYRVNHGLI